MSSEIDSIKGWVKSNISRSPLVSYFCIILLVSLVLTTILSFATRGWFFRYAMDIDVTGDLFGDHFDSIMYSLNDPYGENCVIYPALITLVYAALGWMVEPYAVDNGGNLAQQLAASHYGMMEFLVFILFSFAVIVVICHAMLDKHNDSRLVSIFIACLMFASTPFLYGLERGNCIFYSVIFTVLFLLFYKSESTKIRYLAYIALGISTSIKLFPIMFSFLILVDGRKKEFFACAVLSALIFLIPFLCFDGSPLNLIKTLAGYSTPPTEGDWIENGGNFLNLRQWCSSLCTLLTGEAHPIIGTLVAGGALLLSLILIYLDKEMQFWEGVLIISCNMCIGFSVPAAYIYLNLVPGLLFFFISRQSITKYHYWCLLLLALIFSLVLASAQFKSALVLVLLVSLLTMSVNRLCQKGKIHTSEPIIKNN